jgi:hypothetical protein
MRKLISSTLVFAAAGILAGSATIAQQASTPAPATAGKPATSAAAKSATGQNAGTAKTGQGATAAKKPAATTGAAALLKTEKDKRSYAIGLNIGAKVANELKAGGVDMDSAILARGHSRFADRGEASDDG